MLFLHFLLFVRIPLDFLTGCWGGECEGSQKCSWKAAMPPDTVAETLSQSTLDVRPLLLTFPIPALTGIPNKFVTPLLDQ